MTEIEKLVEKIVAGVSEITAEELQIYVNNTQEVEKRLKELKEEWQR